MEQASIVVLGRYQLLQEVGKGQYGVVWRARDQWTNSAVAVKLELENPASPLYVIDEAAFYRLLEGGTGIPNIIAQDTQDGYGVLVLQLLGCNLEELSDCGRFSLKTTLLLADQLICRLRYIHRRGIVHRDLKPSNVLLGLNRCGNVAYLTDFGCAISACEALYEVESDSTSCVGSPGFASLSGHRGKGDSRFDDLECLAYILISFRKPLPWERETTCESIFQKKRQPAHQICKGLPVEFARFLEHVRDPRVRQAGTPKYSILRNMLRDLFHRSGYRFGFSFDWTGEIYRRYYCHD